LRIGCARHRRRDELFHDEFEIAALAHQFVFAAVLEPHHRTARALFIDESERVPQVFAAVQVEKLGGVLGVIARKRMGGDVVGLLVADPDRAAVVEGFEIMRSGPQHCARGLSRGAALHRRGDGHRILVLAWRYRHAS
jgi:hypothetical protein